MSFQIRPARADDVDAMRQLIDGYAAQDLMLSRSHEFLLEHLGDYVVADDGGFAGCCALAVLTRDLAEIRSLAVKPETSRRGVGKALVDGCVERARTLGLRRVFALTLVRSSSSAAASRSSALAGFRRRAPRSVRCVRSASRATSRRCS